MSSRHGQVVQNRAQHRRRKASPYDQSMPTDPALADELVAAVRAFVDKDVLPVASDLEHADTYPEDLVAGMRRMGLFGCTIPEEFGGLGLDTMTYARIIGELATGWM